MKQAVAAFNCFHSACKALFVCFGFFLSVCLQNILWFWDCSLVTIQILQKVPLYSESQMLTSRINSASPKRRNSQVIMHFKPSFRLVIWVKPYSQSFFFFCSPSVSPCCIRTWCSSAVKVCPQCRHYIFSQPPSFPGSRPRQTAFQEARPTMKGRAHLAVNSFAGGPVGKPRSCYWVPQTLHSTKPRGDLSAPVQQCQILSEPVQRMKLISDWISARCSSLSLGFFWQYSYSEVLLFLDWFTVFCRTRRLEISEPFIWVSLPSGLSGSTL